MRSPTPERVKACGSISPKGLICPMPEKHKGPHMYPHVEWEEWGGEVDHQCPSLLPGSERRCEKYAGHPWEHLTGGDFGLRSWANTEQGEPDV